MDPCLVTCFLALPERPTDAALFCGKDATSDITDCFSLTSFPG